MICTFFGHRDVYEDIQLVLEKAIIDLIVNKGIDTFYVGNQGGFDRIVRKTLKNLQLEFKIDYSVVLAYMPVKANDTEDYADTIYPIELSGTPPKYAILKRNKWMLSMADYVIAYVKYETGGAAYFKALAEKQGKKIINLAEA